jgi:hypothetical protein
MVSQLNRVIMRDHEPVILEEFNGLYIRGDQEVTPPDHEVSNNNVAFIQSGIRTRDGLDLYEPYGNVVRIYTYVYLVVPNSFESLLILDGNGNIYHDKSPTPYTPILTIAGMTDFGFVSVDGRAFINPCNGSTGLSGQSIWIYKGDGTPARLAGGAGPPATPILGLANTGIGNNQIGVHVYAVAFETDTGFITAIGGFANINDPGGDQITISNIPIGPSYVVARRLVATIGIDPTLFSGNEQSQYEFFFIPEGRIADNTTTSITLSFFDSELLEDASYLLNLFANTPAGVGFTTYHNRLVSFAEYSNISLVRVSYVGQPEAFDQVTGLLIIPLDANAITAGQAFQDVLYMFKKTRTFAYTDSGDVPSTWPLTIIDSGIGASVHGVSTVLDSESVNLLYLIIIDFSGVMLFNGAYIRPELSWKIKDYWMALTRPAFQTIQIMNDSIEQIFYITLPNNQMLIGDYSNGLDFKSIRWAIWTFNIETTTITMLNFNQLIIGSQVTT